MVIEQEMDDLSFDSSLKRAGDGSGAGPNPITPSAQKLSAGQVGLGT
jgi:hypothetical protein